MIDTHAHLNLPQFKKDINRVILNAKKTGVKKIIAPATNLQNSHTAINLAYKFPQIYPSCGIHPEQINSLSSINNLKNKILKIARSHNLIAIGECGLDYYRQKDKLKRELQKKLFRLHLEIANITNLPLIIHNRDAEKDFTEIISSTKNFPPAVFHCFSSSEKFLKFILNSGFFVSFAGNITRHKSLQKLVAETPLKKILLETDSPFLIPSPLPKNQRNEPKNVKIIANNIARIKKVSLNSVISQTTKNAKNIFKF